MMSDAGALIPQPAPAPWAIQQPEPEGVNSERPRAADDGPSESQRARGTKGFVRRLIRAVAATVQTALDAVALVTVLAVMTALPLIQLIAFGYLLDVAGRLARGATVRDALDWLRPAGQLALAVVAVVLLGLPIAFLSHWARAAELVSPGTPQADGMRLVAVVLVTGSLIYLGWAWARGGRLRDYLRPQPIRFMKVAWRGSTWFAAADSLWQWLATWRIGARFWLGLRAAFATLLWLLPASVIILASRRGETGAAALVGILAFLALGVALMYLPWLQAHFAAENRFSAMFAVRQVRRDFRRAPWAWLCAMVLALVVLPIPLYLLKIEPPPPELVWLPTWFFIALMMPARIACGLALRRARHAIEPSGWRANASIWLVRLLIPPVVATYLLFVYLSQYVSWDGLQTWVQQHAVLVPVPFVGS